MTTTFATTFRAETARLRATNGQRPTKTRTPILVHVARFAGRAVGRLPRWSVIRTAVLAVAGFGCITAAAWMVAVPLGLLAAGVSLLVIELLGSTGRT